MLAVKFDPTTEKFNCSKTEACLTVDTDIIEQVARWHWNSASVRSTNQTLNSSIEYSETIIIFSTTLLLLNKF